MVLSTCVSGLGRYVYREIVGLRSAFKVAGAHSVIMSLWHVDDFASAVFMHIFYSYLPEHGIIKALTYTKLYVRELTIGTLTENGWFSDRIMEKTEDQRRRITKLSKNDIGSKPFHNEYYWAGFVCQIN